MGYKLHTRFSTRIKSNTVIRFLVFMLIFILYILFHTVFKLKLRFIDEVFSLVFFFTAYYLTPSVKVDENNLVSPKNLMLLVFFVRLVISPLTIIIWGYQKWVIPINPAPDEIHKAYLITILAFVSFIVGWDLSRDKSEPVEIRRNSHFKFRNNAIIAGGLFLAFLFIILFYFGSIEGYLKSLFLENYFSLREDKGKGIIYLNIMFKYGISFLGIILGLLALDRIKGGVWLKSTVAFISLIVIILFSLGPSRNNMVFPVLAFLAAAIPKYVRIRYRDFVLGSVGFILIAFFFQNFRWHRNQENMEDLNGGGKFIEFIQVYFGAPHTMTPILRLQEEGRFEYFTLHASLLETLPVLGKPLRERSGSYVYNVAYDRIEVRDQVFPTHGEIYYNFGWIGILFIFVLTGYFYRAIHDFFINETGNDLLFRSIVFYFTLIFNATIFYSYSVLGQFVFYNSIVVLMIMIFRDKTRYEI